ncbi:hypothetical protein B0T11DRAFT_135586 [Plectosphaerella cucumerina]|uniref:Uncharacterized protein n=1 Tax=Plectosphaerella cucumerina TaxID=40658 RepID=A0A8K0TAP9_9PEZI|nr:hypothetical protein B0T11DRAFT_135586 [Plectosphaerella cucumerina]
MRDLSQNQNGSTRPGPPFPRPSSCQLDHPRVLTEHIPPRKSNHHQQGSHSILVISAKKHSTHHSQQVFMTPSCIRVAATVQLWRARVGRPLRITHAAVQPALLAPGILWHPPLASGSLPPVHHTISRTHGSPSSPPLRRDSCSRPPAAFHPRRSSSSREKKQENSRTRSRHRLRAQGPGARNSRLHNTETGEARNPFRSGAKSSPALRRSSAVLCS